MVRRPASLPEARRAMREALQWLNEGDSRAGRPPRTTPCQDRPVPYTEVRQTPEEAAALCAECPLIAECRNFGWTESIYANDMVYGGLAWRKGKPLDGPTLADLALPPDEDAGTLYL